MANLSFTKKGLYDFLQSNPSLQLQANFEFRWPLVFNDDSFLIDTLEVPEVDSTQGYMYLDGYQLPVLGTPRFTNAIRISFWVKEPFIETYEPLFNELFGQELEGSEAFIIPCSTDKYMKKESGKLKTLHLYDVKLKQMTTDEHSAASQALVHINLTLAFGAFNITEENSNLENGIRNDGLDESHDIEEKNAADLASTLIGNGYY